MRGIIEDVRERIEAIAEELGVVLDAPAVDRLVILRGLWLAQGRAINLTGAESDDGLVHHVADGLATVACAQRLVGRPLDDACHWLDVGSGGGFPALVVAAATPARMVLVEPRQRRAAFLEFALASIGNKSVVIRARIGDPTWREYAKRTNLGAEYMPFAIATSRAVFAPETWLETGDKLVMRGGFVLVHLRPEQGSIGAREPEAIVDWGRSRIAGFRRA